MSGLLRPLAVCGLVLASCGAIPGIGLAQKTPDSPRGARILEKTMLWEVSGPDRGRLTLHLEALVENEKGRDVGYTEIPYDTFSKVTGLRGTIRDRDGRVRRKLEDRDVEDRSAIGEVSLYDDVRVRTLRLLDDRYPYVVEYQVEISFSGLLSWPTWTPFDIDLPVDRSTFSMRIPRAMEARYAVRGDLPEPVVTVDSGMREYHWEVELLAPFEGEDWGPAWDEQVPHVETGPTRFEIEHYPGRLSSWSELGRWYFEVSSGQRRLPTDFVGGLRARISRRDTLSMVQATYAGLQDATRYVSVQLGIGGWRPHSAEYVLERGYGDCKALSNYLQAMLEALGIGAHPVLIRSGTDEGDIGADFPSFQFNHVIVAVPTARDTVWLEATSQILPFGQIGPWNEDRHALVVGADGGKLVRTPATPSTGSRRERTTDLVLNGGGAAVMDVRTVYTGNQQAAMLSLLSDSDPDDREAWLRRNGGVGTVEIVRSDFDGIRPREPTGVLTYALRLPNLASRTRGRLLVPLNPFRRVVGVPPEMPDRTQPVVYPYAFLDTDEVMIHLPDGFTVEALPRDVQLEAAFGSYRASAVHLDSERAIRYSRRLEISRRRIRPEEYDLLREFLAEAARADRAQFVLSRN